MSRAVIVHRVKLPQFLILKKNELRFEEATSKTEVEGEEGEEGAEKIV